MYRVNSEKEQRINEFGITVDLPLFNQPQDVPRIQHPDWLWSGSSIKAEVYNTLKEKFAVDSFEYLNALLKLGGRATDHEVMSYFNNPEKWPLHIISARRNYFVESPFYIVTSFPDQKIRVQLSNGRIVYRTIWIVNYKNLFSLM
jgi:hypothetical protein